MRNLFLFLKITYYVFVLPALISRTKLTDLCKRFTPGKIEVKYENKDIIRFTEFLVSLRIPTFRNRCLKKCLILYKLLGENGMRVSINIGIKADRKNRVRAHSWLTTKGKPYLTDHSVIKEFKLVHTSS